MAQNKCQIQKKSVLVHIAYFDESAQQGSLAIFGAVIIPHGNFGWAERVHSIAVEQVFPVEEIEERFQEFHAQEIFKGEGAFKGIPKEKRFDAIRILLLAMREYNLPFIYSAVDEKKLSKSPISRGLFEAAHPLIAAFKLCALGVEKWAQDRHRQTPDVISVGYQDLYLLIADEMKDQELKKRLRASYRLLRAARPYNSGMATNRLWHAHDQMYFGDSSESVGIQMADLCTYFMQRQLAKRNRDTHDEGDEFFHMFVENAICAKPEPEWSQYRDLLVSHEPVPLAGLGTS